MHNPSWFFIDSVLHAAQVCAVAIYKAQLSMFAVFLTHIPVESTEKSGAQAEQTRI